MAVIRSRSGGGPHLGLPESFCSKLMRHFKGVHDCVELFCCFLGRFMANGAVQPFGIVPADPSQSFPVEPESSASRKPHDDFYTRFKNTTLRTIPRFR
jgi:hypothetical protein